MAGISHRKNLLQSLKSSEQRAAFLLQASRKGSEFYQVPISKKFPATQCSKWEASVIYKKTDEGDCNGFIFHSNE